VAAHDTHGMMPMPASDRQVPDERAAVRAELRTGERDVVIIQVSRMEALKGHAAHLEALGLLKDAPGWTCWIIGGAQRPCEVTYLKNLKQRASRLGIADRVRFTGERADVPRMLAAADIYCQPNSGPESFGLTFMEAMLARLPVVTTGIGGAKEIVDDSCGVLLPLDDAQALAASLRCLINESQLRTHLGACGLVRARQLCDPSRQIRRLNEVLIQMS